MNDENKLDEFLPNIETLYGIRTQLTKAGVDSSAIPEDWLKAISAAFVKHICKTEEGHNFISQLLNFRWQQGLNTKEYILLNERGEEIKDIQPKDISTFNGCLIAGVPVNPSRVKINDLPGYRCDDCGVRAHCVTEVLNYRRDQIDSLCNTCLKHSEEAKQRDYHVVGLCDSCDDLNCPHNPKMEEHRLENEVCMGQVSASGRIR